MVPTTLTFVYLPLFAGVPMSIAESGYWTLGCHTSQFSKRKQRHPVTDLRGGKASEESFTPRRNNLAMADAVDFHWPDLFSAVAFNLSWSELSAP